MNNHTLSEYPKITSLIVIVFIVLSGISDSFAQEEQTITLTTNKNSYLPGDTVQLNGVVSSQPSQLVALQVKDSSGNLILIRTVQTDNVGSFMLQFKIPSTATSGDFSIVASARINGFVVTQTKTMSATVPEFGSISIITLGVSFLVMSVFLTYSNRFKNYSRK